MKALVFMNQNIRTPAGRRRACVVVKAAHHKRGVHGRSVRWIGTRGGVRASTRASRRITSHHVHAWVEVNADRIEVLRGGRWQRVRAA